MHDEEKKSSIENFENIPIDSLGVRGLRNQVIKALMREGIKSIRDLKGKTSKELPNVMYIDVLGEILYIIGIEEKLDWEYFREYPLISKENDTIAEICKDPLNVSLYRLDCPNTVATALGRRKEIRTIKDLIGMRRDEILGTYGIGYKTGDELCIALQRHNVTVIGGNFHIDLETDKSTNIQNDLGDGALQQLQDLFCLAAKVSKLDVQYITKANDALRSIIKGAREIGDGTND